MNSNLVTTLLLNDHDDGIVIDLALSFSNRSLVVCPSKKENSSFMPLLKKYDTSKSRGLVSHLPLEYLEDFATKKNIKYDKNPDDIVTKRNVLDAIKNTNNKDHLHALRNGIYKDVPVKLFLKPLITADFSTKYYNTQFYKWKESKNICNVKYPLAYAPKRNEHDEQRSTWMSINNINDILIRIRYLMDDPQDYKIAIFYPDDYTIRDRLNLLSHIQEDVNLICKTGINQSLDKYLSDPDLKYLAVIILADGHFTSGYIDNITKKCFFFNSGGYSSQTISSRAIYKNNVLDIYDINNAYAVSNGGTTNSITNYDYAVSYMVYLLQYRLNITTFIYNSLSVQGYGTDCGIFTIIFLTSCIIKDKDSELAYKYPYITFACKNDAIMRTYRSVLFITVPDLQNNPSKYTSAIETIDITNSLYNEYRSHFYEKIENLVKYLKSFLNDE